MKHLRYQFLFVLLFSFTALFITEGCSSTVPKDDGSNQPKRVVEDFDFTGFKTVLSIKEIPAKDVIKISPITVSDIWYSFENDTFTRELKKEKEAEGEVYRIQIFVSDKLDAAEKTKDEVSKKLKGHEIVIDFLPPNFVVKVGRFTRTSDATEVKNKLYELGYRSASIVREKTR